MQLKKRLTNLTTKKKISAWAKTNTQKAKLRQMTNICDFYHRKKYTVHKIWPQKTHKENNGPIEK